MDNMYERIGTGKLSKDNYGSDGSIVAPNIPKQRPNARAALQKLATSFAKKKAEKNINAATGISSWQLLVKNALNLQKGKIPLLLAVEAGNQSMCRELLSAQTADQLKVCTVNIID